MFCFLMRFIVKMNCVSCLYMLDLVEENPQFQAFTSNLITKIDELVAERIAASTSNILARLAPAAPPVTPGLLVADLAKNSASLVDPPA